MADRKHPKNKKGRSRQRIEVVLSELLTASAVPSDDGSRKTRWKDFQRLWSGQMSRIAAKSGVPRNRREDLIREVLLKMIARWDEFRRPGGAQEWLALSGKMVHDASVDMVRQLNRRGGQSLQAELIDDRANDPASLAEAKEWHERLSAHLERLEEKNTNYAWLLREHFLQERPIKELAAERGVTEHAIHCRMSRAIKALRRLASASPHDGEASL